MQIRALKTFFYLVGHENVRVPRGLSVDLPDDAAHVAINAGAAIVVEGAAPAATPSARQSDDLDMNDMSHAELLTLAEKRGVEVKKSNSKAEIATAIKAAT